MSPVTCLNSLQKCLTRNHGAPQIKVHSSTVLYSTVIYVASLEASPPAASSPKQQAPRRVRDAAAAPRIEMFSTVCTAEKCTCTVVVKGCQWWTAS